MGLRAGLDRRGKSRPHWDSNPGTVQPVAVAIPTELPGPHVVQRLNQKDTAESTSEFKLKIFYEVSLLKDVFRVVAS